MERDTIDGLIGTRSGTPLPGGGTLVAILLALVGGAWLISARLATPDMRLGVLTGASVPPASSQMVPASSQMGMPGSRSMSMGMDMDLGGFIVAWTVMMAAMMVPSLVPAVRLFATRADMTVKASSAAALMIASYLLVWGAVGGVAYLVLQALQGGAPLGSAAALREGAALLVVAGVYQLAPPKQACLRRCRSPRTGAAPQLDGHLRGYRGAVRAGLWQGVWCLGSSWPLMLVLLLVGMMNLAWMGVIAVVIFAEKVVPGGDVISKVAGWGLAGWGLVLLASPHALPALGGA